MAKISFSKPFWFSFGVSSFFAFLSGFTFGLIEYDVVLFSMFGSIFGFWSFLLLHFSYEVLVAPEFKSEG